MQTMSPEIDALTIDACLLATAYTGMGPDVAAVEATGQLAAEVAEGLNRHAGTLRLLGLLDVQAAAAVSLRRAEAYLSVVPGAGDAEPTESFLHNHEETARDIHARHWLRGILKGDDESSVGTWDVLNALIPVVEDLVIPAAELPAMMKRREELTRSLGETTVDDVGDVQEPTPTDAAEMRPDKPDVMTLADEVVAYMAANQTEHGPGVLIRDLRALVAERLQLSDDDKLEKAQIRRTLLQVKNRIAGIVKETSGLRAFDDTAGRDHLKLKNPYVAVGALRTARELAKEQ